MAAFYEELFKQNATLWNSMSESMGSLGNDGMTGFTSFWRESGGKAMERFLTGGFPGRIGPACFHQEKVDGAVKHLGALNAALLEFTAYMMLPVEAAFKHAVKEVGSANTPEDWKAFGEHMMRHMEEGYQGLFTSKGYLDALDMLMVTAGEARHRMMGVGEDLLQASGVPSLREMDALSRDVYQLKKRVGVLEKEDGASQKSA
ncbi:poly(R)-hydroxyalkanoic acid synthase subunit PhaE [Desulfoluna butyratoxydans]|uniref:Poly(3-hydroxyalkanoate) polymerase subunit PhaE n=1 Tax=Desulfoluna butyratoxydans TaxID=231438 RepID=A0A4U8YPH2_9BACT|nr:poly(R)-hydroxyalkanoic acid synthase subunit PhaE [Desulfoluna butyratoxydans]VFQ45681.1 poly(r)-hydroxyalkanoic acid synthase class iii phae subunit [Desulfoluna butyratoxydans]